MRVLVAIVLAVFLISPAASAAVTPITGMLGPNDPALVDVNGLQTATPGGVAAIPMRSGTQLLLSSPWSDLPVTGTLCAYDSVKAKYAGICRTMPNGLNESITITGFNGSGNPNQFAYNETGNLYPKDGTATLVDQNGDGIWDGLRVTGSGGSFIVPFVYVDTNGDGFADYISIPWSFAPLLGLNPNHGVVNSQGTAGPNPQVWIPLADTNGDGKPDAIVLDLTGSGSPDPDLFSSPAMGPVPAAATLAPPVPTLSEWGMLAVILGLAAVAMWRLRIQLG